MWFKRNKYSTPQQPNEVLKKNKNVKIVGLQETPQTKFFAYYSNYY